MALEKELETYKRELPKLLEENAGRFALIHGDELVSIWDTWEDAIQEGYRIFHLEPFMVNEIEPPGAKRFIRPYVMPACRS